MGLAFAQIFSKGRNDPESLTMKFVDDISIAAKVNLDKELVEDVGRMKPLNFSERFETKLSEDFNTLQELVNR